MSSSMHADRRADRRATHKKHPSILPLKILLNNKNKSNAIMSARVQEREKRRNGEGENYRDEEKESKREKLS